MRGRFPLARQAQVPARRAPTLVYVSAAVLFTAGTASLSLSTLPVARSLGQPIEAPGSISALRVPARHKIPPACPPLGVSLCPRRRPATANNSASSGATMPKLSSSGSSRPTRPCRRPPSITSNNAHANSPPTSPVGSWSNGCNTPPTPPPPPLTLAHAAVALASRRRSPTSPDRDGSLPHGSDPSPSGASAGVARPVGSSFSPSDEQLGLTQEGYSPAVIRLVIRQGARFPSPRPATTWRRWPTSPSVPCKYSACASARR